MKDFLGLCALLLSFSSSVVATESTAVNNLPNGAVSLKVTTKSGARNKTAPFLHGLFFEDINVGPPYPCNFFHWTILTVGLY